MASPPQSARGSERRIGERSAFLGLGLSSANEPAAKFDVPSLSRFGLYVALGLGYWLGAAAVERMLDMALN